MGDAEMEVNLKDFTVRKRLSDSDPKEIVHTHKETASFR
jgi:hypothetical protein